MDTVSEPQAASALSPGEVSHWIRAIRSGNSEAQQKLWDCYFPQVVALAQRKLSGVRGIADAEDVALSALHSLLRGAHAGRFTRMSNRHDLWLLLFAITRQKVVSLRRYEQAQKRRARSAVRVDLDEAAFDELAAKNAGPEFLAVFEDLIGRLFECLPTDELRRVARLRLEGWSNLEIADELRMSVRTVERKLQLIQTVWRLFCDDSAAND